MFASDFNSNHIVKPMNKKRDREFSSLRRMRKNVFREHARRQLVVESLEDRRLLTVGFLPAPDWVEQGPSAVSNGQVTVPPSNQINGAAETIAFNPINTNNAYAGTVNGGVWRTNNFRAANPT